MIKKFLSFIVIVLVFCVFIVLLTNKTFFKTTYIGTHNQDIFIPLWFEPESKRLKNYDTENIVYSWEKPKSSYPDKFGE